MNYTLEICSNSVQSALNAQSAGASRVELCDNLWESGTTPSYGTIKKARELLGIQLFVLIRPRGGDFVYSDLEFEIIKEDIIACKEMGVDGIVSGLLNADNTIDMGRTKELIEISRPLPFTFHRAFDVSPNLLESLAQLISLGADRVLTSGGHENAPDGNEIITQLCQMGKGKISIQPGGGINSENIVNLFPTGCREFHLTGNALRKSPAQAAALNLNGTSSIPERDYLESSTEGIKQVIRQLDSHFNKL
jgi:copper homeostasis protein